MRRGLSLLVCVLTVFALLLQPDTAHALDELKNTDPDKYYILLDLRNQIVTVYERDDAGAYTRIVRRFLCTTGRTEVDPEDPEDEATPTPKGIWKMGGRERFGKFANFGNEYARYWTQIVGDVYFHSIMFSRRDVNKLKSGAYQPAWAERIAWLRAPVRGGRQVAVLLRLPRHDHRGLHKRAVQPGAAQGAQEFPLVLGL